MGGAQACKVHIQTRANANANAPASQDEDAQGGASGKSTSSTTSTLSSDLLLVTLPLGVLKSGPLLTKPLCLQQCNTKPLFPPLPH